MRKRTFALALTVALVVGLLPLGASAAPIYTVGEAVPVSLQPNSQIQPDIDYPWMVWIDHRESKPNVYAYNFVTGEEKQVTDTPMNLETNPSVSGDWVVYHYDPEELQQGTIAATNLVTDEVVVIADGAADGWCYGNPAIDGTTVVFRNDDDGGIYAYDLADRAAGTWLVSRTYADDGGTRYGPEIGDGWVVCRAYDPSTGWYNIEAYDLTDLAGAPIVIPSNNADWISYDGPSTDAGMLVFERYGYWDYTGDAALEYGYAIILYDLEAGTEEPISSVDANTSYRYHPVINDGLVSWHDNRDAGSSNYSVYCWDEVNGERLLREGFATDDRGGRTTTGDGIVAWHDHRDEGVIPSSFEVHYEDLYYMFVDSVPPVAVDDTYTTSQNAPLSIVAPGVLANDTDADGDAISAAKLTDPANGSVAINANGSFVYVPDGGFTGTDTFQYEVSDGTYYSVATVTVTVAPSVSVTDETGAVYRFYNPVSGSHFYTPSLEERNYVISHYLGVWIYEGYAFTALPAQGTVGIHRFYNAKAGSHFYTPSDTEQATVLAKWPTIFTYEGRSFAVTLAPGANTLTVHRFCNTKTGAHFYTASEAEKASVIATYPDLFIYEGVGFYTVTSL